MRKLGFLLLTALFALACAPAEEPATPAVETSEPAPEPAAEEVAPSASPTAVATLRNAAGEEIGTATFTEGEGGVALRAIVNGVPSGRHGLHLHEKGFCEPDFDAAGGLFIPEDAPYDCPPDPERHAAYFGNIVASEGGALLEVVSDLVTVSPGPASLVGKAVIVHQGGYLCSEPSTSTASGRFACGVILLE
ncbi:MAG: superoxide dismutase family protein [Acidobacteriota bacterium]